MNRKKNVIKHSYKCLSVYYINIANSLILSSHKKSDQSLFSCPKNSFSSRQKYFNLMWIIHILVNLHFRYVYFSFVNQAVKKLNQKKKKLNHVLSNISSSPEGF